MCEAMARMSSRLPCVLLVTLLGFGAPGPSMALCLGSRLACYALRTCSFPELVVRAGVLAALSAVHVAHSGHKHLQIFPVP